MRRNRKVSRKMSRMAAHVFRIAGCMAFLFAFAALNLTASTTCNQLMKTVDERDRELRLRTAELDRATARWDAMRSSENLDRALVKWGLAMRPPSSSQIVRMDRDGSPLPGQVSVALLRQRAGAQYSAQTPRRPARRAVR